MCGRILGDLGADVVKLEAIDGDPLRLMPPVYRGLSGYFAQYNRNKRAIAVDLKTEQGWKIAQRLATRVDVLIENFRPGVAHRLGLDYASLRRDNPGLIYASINGFGDDGPYASQPAYDSVIQGLVGFMPVQGTGDQPVPVRNPVVDKIAAMSAALSILAAFGHRYSNGGIGQRVNVRMLDAWAAFILPERMHNHVFQNPDAPQSQPRDVFRVFDTSDGHVIGLIFQDNQFQGICQALGRADLRDDPRFADPLSRVLNIDHLHAALRNDIAALTTDQFLAKTRTHHVPFARVNDIDGFLADEQVCHNSTYFDVADHEFGPMRHLGFMAAFSATPFQLRRRPPKLGEHTDEVLTGLGYSTAAIDQLRAAGAIR